MTDTIPDLKSLTFSQFMYLKQGSCDLDYEFSIFRFLVQTRGNVSVNSEAGMAILYSISEKS